MAQFFQGRDPIGSTFYLNRDPKERISCTAFNRWIDTNQGITLHCGRDANIEISKTVGLDEKKSETSEDSIESTLGVTGVAQLKSQMKEIFGYEIHWNRATTTKASLSRKAPPCGRYELAVQQLIREYDFAFFRRGRWPFRDDIWDLKEQRTVPEYTETYDLMEDDFEFDERCKKTCGTPATAPDYEGRVSLDFRNVILNAPFKISASGFIIIRLGREEIPIEGLTRSDVERQSQLIVPEAWLPEIARFLGDFSTETVTGSISFDPRFTPAEPAVVQYEITEEVQRDLRSEHIAGGAGLWRY